MQLLPVMGLRNFGADGREGKAWVGGERRASYWLFAFVLLLLLLLPDIKGRIFGWRKGQVKVGRWCVCLLLLVELTAS